MTKSEFNRLLLKHDWSYQYSDDARAYDQGQIEAAQIRALTEQDPELRQMLEAFRAGWGTPLMGAA